MEYTAKTIIYDKNGNEVISVDQYVVSVKSETNLVSQDNSSTVTYIELIGKDSTEFKFNGLFSDTTKIIFNTGV